MCYDVLQCVAVCCSVLLCVAVCCNALHLASRCVAVCCSVLQSVAVCCSLLQSVAVCFSLLQCVQSLLCLHCESADLWEILLGGVHTVGIFFLKVTTRVIPYSKYGSDLTLKIFGSRKLCTSQTFVCTRVEKYIRIWIYVTVILDFAQNMGAVTIFGLWDWFRSGLDMTYVG